MPRIKLNLSRILQPPHAAAKNAARSASTLHDTHVNLDAPLHNANGTAAHVGDAYANSGASGGKAEQRAVQRTSRRAQANANANGGVGSGVGVGSGSGAESSAAGVGPSHHLFMPFDRVNPDDLRFVTDRRRFYDAYDAQAFRGHSLSASSQVSYAPFSALLLHKTRILQEYDYEYSYTRALLYAPTKPVYSYEYEYYCTRTLYCKHKYCTLYSTRICTLY